MANSKFIQVNKEIEKAVIKNYKKTENFILDSFRKIEDKFIEQFLKHTSESVEKAKIRLNKQKNNINNKNRRF